MPFASRVFLQCLMGDLVTPKLPKFLPMGNATTQCIRSGPQMDQNASFNARMSLDGVNDVTLNFGSQTPKKWHFGCMHWTFKHEQQKFKYL